MLDDHRARVLHNHPTKNQCSIQALVRSVKMKKRCLISVSLLGAFLLIVGLVLLLYVIPEFMKYMLYQNLALRNGTEQAERFVSAPVPVYLSFYFFNVTNKDAVNKFNEEPVLQEVGPYVYRQVRYKEVSAYDDKNGVVRYKLKRTYYFEPNLTKGTLSDKINHINAVTVGIADVLEKNLGPAARAFTGSLPGEYIETHTADELMFNGFSLEDHFPPMFRRLCSLVQNCTFGFYYGRNGTVSKEYEVSSGVLGLEDYTKVFRYDEKPALNYWYGDRCNDINGTDGQQFPPGVTREATPYVFGDDFCRSIYLQYEQDVTVEGIDALQFVIPDTLFADANKYKPNMCFCQADATKSCPAKKGVFLIGKCQQGGPVAGSAPHFYQGEPEYWQRFKGLRPDKSKHYSFLNVEPMTGQVISAAKRLQANVVLYEDSNVPILKGVTNLTFFPVFWIEEAATVTPDLAAEFRHRVTIPYKSAWWCLIFATVIGGLILLAILVILIKKRVQPSKNKEYLACAWTNHKVCGLESKELKSQM